MKFKPGTFITVPNAPILKGMKSQTQLIYLWINHFTDRNGLCYPSSEILAQYAKVSKNTVFRSILELEEIGLLKRTKRYGDKGQLTNSYQILQIPTQGDESLGRDKNGVGESLGLPRDTVVIAPVQGGESLGKDRNQKDELKGEGRTPREGLPQKKDTPKSILAGDSKNPFTKLLLPSEITSLLGVWDRWVEDTPTRERMLWLVEHTEVCIPSIEEEIPRFLFFVDKSSEEIKKGRDLFIWLKEWIIAAKKNRRIDFYKMADGHWLPDGEHSLTDGTALIVSGGFNFRERVERALTKPKYHKFLEDQNARALAEWKPDPEDEEDFNHPTE